MAISGNAAPQGTINDATEEPSMDDIMASIRQIIAEDEQAIEGARSERDRYTHPTNPSNVNEPQSDEDSEFMSAMEQEMKAVVNQEVATQMEAPVVSVRPEAPNVDQVSRPGEQVAQAGFVAAGVSIHDRAERVRSEIGLSSVDSNGLSLEQRLEKYRVRSRRQEELKKVQDEERAAERKFEAAAVQRIVEALPAQVQPMITPESVAQSLMKASGSSISSDLTAIMRPVVREWLSENLPGMVERLVREEIERVSRGRKTG